MRILLVIDDANIDLQVKKLGRRANYIALRDFVADPTSGRHLWEAILFTTVPPQNGDGIRRFHHAPKAQGMIIVEKEQKQLPDGRRKGNMYVEIAVETMRYASSGKPDVVVLASGDGDFAPLAMYLRSNGLRVEVASLRDSLAGEIRAAANGVIDLAPWVNRCEQVTVPGFRVPDNAPQNFVPPSSFQLRPA